MKISILLVVSVLGGAGSVSRAAVVGERLAPAPIVGVVGPDLVSLPTYILRNSADLSLMKGNLGSIPVPIMRRLIKTGQEVLAHGPAMAVVLPAVKQVAFIPNDLKKPGAVVSLRKEGTAAKKSGDQAYDDVLNTLSENGLSDFEAGYSLAHRVFDGERSRRQDAFDADGPIPLEGGLAFIAQETRGPIRDELRVLGDKDRRLARVAVPRGYHSYTALEAPLPGGKRLLQLRPYSGKGVHLAVLSGGGQLDIIRKETKSIDLNGAMLHPNGKELVFLDDGREDSAAITSYDFRAGRMKTVKIKGELPSAFLADVSPDGRYAAVWSDPSVDARSPSISVVNLKTGGIMARTGLARGAADARFSKDGATLRYSQDGKERGWDWKREAAR